MRTLALLAILLLPLAAARDPATPLPPSDVSASLTPTGVLVKWAAPAFEGGSPITAYRVQSNPDGLSWVTVATTDGSTLSTMVNDEATMYRVIAVNEQGPSLPSAPATLLNCPPVVIGLSPPGYTINWECIDVPRTIIVRPD